jgi:hypothetical protein
MDASKRYESALRYAERQMPDRTPDVWEHFATYYESSPSSRSLINAWDVWRHRALLNPSCVGGTDRPIIGVQSQNRKNGQ